MSVAETILQQLGNGRFVAMTGASKFLSTPNSLTFDIPWRPPSPITKVRVTLNHNDLYDIEFWRYVRTELTLVTIYHDHDISAENLRETFERRTGLRTSL